MQEGKLQKKVTSRALFLWAKKYLCNLWMTPKGNYKAVKRLEIWFYNILITIDVKKLEKYRDFRYIWLKAEEEEDEGKSYY